MSVQCEGCGRAYDAARFEGGRTLWCACGHRVGVRLAPDWPRVGEPHRFIADAMLGRLARWLRLLGFDCAWEAEVSDEALVGRSLAEERLLLTCDRALPEEWWVSTIHLIETEAWPDQLVDVLRRFRLVPEIELFSRCGDCNLRLEPARAGDLPDRVPADVLEQGLVLRRCPGCDRLFWEGSHTDRMRDFIEAALADV